MLQVINIYLHHLLVSTSNLNLGTAIGATCNHPMICFALALGWPRNA
jgi:hypothetical protein